MKLFQFSWLALGLAILGACSGQQKQTEAPKEQVVNVYSHRHYPSDEQLFAKFTQATGIKVNVIDDEGDDKLLQRMEREGKDCPADLLITTDAGRLYRAKAAGVLQAVETPTLNTNVPSTLRDAERHWYGLTMRARIIAYSKKRVKPEQLSTYEALTEPKWKKKVLVRPGNNIYNQSLLAGMIASQGADKAAQWAKGIVANMAREPKGSDRDQMKAVAQGLGDVAIVNTYYVGMLLNSEDTAEREVGAEIGVFFPNQQDRGTHVNISGAGVAKYAPNKENAIKLLEFLSGIEAQEVFAGVNYEYPVNPAVKPAALLQEWGTFKADTTDFNLIGKLNADAMKLFTEAGWK